MFSAFCWPTFCGVVKAAFYVCLWTFRWKRIFWNKIEVLLTVFELEWKMICLLPKNFDRCVWIRIYLSLGTFWAKKLFLKNVHLSRKIRTLSKKSSAFCQKIFAAGLPKLLLWFHGNISEKNRFLKKKLYFFNLFRTLSEEISTFCRKMIVRMSKLPLRVHRTSLKKQKFCEKYMVSLS